MVFANCFPSTLKRKAVVSNSSEVQIPSFLQIPLNSVFKNLRFRDGLIWTVGLTVEISDVTDLFSGVVWMMPKRNTIVYDSHLNITFLLFFDACKCYGYV